MRVRINQIDHILVQPGPLDNSSLPRVPVIRIYGASSVGQKTCLNVHQVYPYVFVEYNGKINPESVNRYIAKLSHSLNHAIAISMRRNPHSPGSQFIRAVLLVKGVHFYGFHTGYSPFLKILFADPTFVNRTVTILQSGTVMQTRFRVYESHLTYILQFMCDFGLYGCGWIDLGEVWRRGDEEDEFSETESAFKPSPYFRQSRMPLEIDVAAHQILNRHLLSAREIHQKLEIPAPALPPEPLVISVRELWEDERRRRVENGLPPSPSIPVDPSEKSRGAGGGWVAEARWWEEIRQRIEREKGKEVKLKEQGWERWVMTTFESIEALWESEWKTWRPKKLDATPRDGDEMANGAEAESGVDHVEENPFGDATGYVSWKNQPTIGHEEVDVDETWLSSQEMTQLVEREEAEWGGAREDNMAYGSDEGERSQDEGGLPNAAEEGPPPGLQHAEQVNRSHGEVIVTSDPNFSPLSQGNSSPRKIPDGPRPLKRRKRNHEARSQEVSQPTWIPSPLDSTQLSSGLTSSARPTSQVVIHFSQFRRDYAMSNSFAYAVPPPSKSELVSTVDDFGVPSKVYRDPYYSRESDAPDKPREYAGLVYHLKGGSGMAVLEEWETNAPAFPECGGTATGAVCGWEYAGSPPSVREVERWLKLEAENCPRRGVNMRPRSQIEGPTQANPYGIKNTPLAHPDSAVRERRSMTILSLEMFAPSRGDFLPDSDVDEIVVVFYSFQEDGPVTTGEASPNSGIIAIENSRMDPRRMRDFPIEFVTDELELLNRTVDIISELDPDILVGWDVQAASWGYLGVRARHYGFDIGELLSRAPARQMGGGNQQWGLRTSSTFKVVGRHVLNVWRIMRSEQTLNIYTFENVALHVLRRRVPRYSPATLTAWLNSDVPSHTSRVFQYFRERTSMVLEMLEAAEVVTKTAEFARVFGVDFFSVISRGSQFKVESFMFRIAKPESFVLLSPSKQDVGKQNAAECMPLIMEPLSAFYNSPLVVLDFQSLYPSVMIAYNYCYSTCLGRIIDFKGRNKFGVADLNISPGLLETLQEHLFVAPNGILYVKPEVRKGLLGRMLTELLDTRIMVKQAMKSAKGDKLLTRLLDARQLGLKYILNVTYGYTSATYSGRMPAVEIADSIVQTGRETLEKAIRVIESTKKWGAKVVYGDTDSVFVYLRGKTKDQAFSIGHDIADTITAMNPVPIKLKFEKVYLPCVLMAKKRYVGFKYETPDDKQPVFDAKGIETVRRDGVPAQQKMTETCLKILFRSQDLSEVKDYCYSSWTKILENKVSIQDFIFAKEVKMGTYSDRVPPPPGVTVAARRMMEDQNDEPQYGERIPYVITRGEPNSRLVDRAVAPQELFDSRHKRLDGAYYISRVLIPPLERIFNLVGADVRAWYDEMPKTIRAEEPDPIILSPKKPKPDINLPNRFKIDDHFRSSQCIVCGGLTSAGVCDECRATPQPTIAALLARVRKAEKNLKASHDVCVSCTGGGPAEPILCESLDCSWLFERKKAEDKAESLVLIHELIEEMEAAQEEP
ncbi:hypothetical protein JAAARDRAFT_53942 [Jaapia argillacea MUCL 33604]|uniref:DNA polymerase n=1 Tax=Jaapia argillacea MUCL 33604 TaxID=933084 RepID=A0A067QC61_9AGAM|nr:hypothetical protein JAAARDRAFT_53942 [Jaapia argillacea MUCL 33604]